MKHVPVLDATALEALRDIQQRCLNKGSHLTLVELQPEPLELLKQYGLESLVSQTFSIQQGSSTAIKMQK
jgi:anti-anti-sigma regulatory factor